MDKTDLEPIADDVILSAEAFKDMILFSGRYANPSIPSEEWKEVYGFLAGELINVQNEFEGADASGGGVIKKLYIKKLVPMVHGTRTEVYFSEQDYGLSEKVMDELLKAGMFICGWFHTHPGLGLFLSETDIINQLGFQSAFPKAIAAVFDFTKISNKSNGLKIYRLENPDLGISSPYYEVLYEIETIEDVKGGNKLFLAKSLIDISDKYQSGGPLIMEAGEVMNELGSLESVLNEDVATVKSQSQLRDELNETEKYRQGQYQQDQYQQDQYQQDQYQQDQYQQDHANNSIKNTYNLGEEEDWELRALFEKLEMKQNKGEKTGFILIKLANKIKQKSRSEALGYLESAEEEFKEDNNKIGLAIVRNELGLIYEDLGDYEMALAEFDSALSILRELNDYKKIVQVLNNIGNVHLKLIEYDKAYEYYRKAYKLAKANGYMFGIITTLLNTVDVLLFLRNYINAYHALAAVLKFFDKTKNDFGKSIALSKFGKLYYEQGPDYYDLALSYLYSALDIKKYYGYNE
ncbi:MAG: tetratricopeptide repeat protein, partial [Promethearchaeota archaeon]